MTRFLLILPVLAMLIMVSTPIFPADLHMAQTPPSQQKYPEDMIEDGMKMILNALSLILKSIPQYKAPEVLENGDIIRPVAKVGS